MFIKEGYKIMLDDITYCETCEAEIEEGEEHDFDGNSYCESCFEDIPTCSNCSEKVNDEHVTIEGEIYCYDCEGELFFYCEDCEETHSIDDQNWIDEKSICNTCRDDNYTCCEDCGEYTSNDYSHYISSGYGYHICQSCYENNGYGSCEICGEMHSENNIVYRNDCYYCADCAPSGSDNRIHDYSYKPNLRFLRTAKEKNQKRTVYMGIELEIDTKSGEESDFESFCDYTENKNSSNIYLKEDSSLKNGLEIVSHPASLAYHKQELGWAKIQEKAKESGFTSHDAGTCGLHIHVGRGSINKVDTLKMSYFVKEHKKEFIKLARRGGCTWSRFKGKEKKLAECSENSERGAVNFGNATTIEFRMFKGTLNNNTLLATIELIDSLVNWVHTVNINTILNNTASWKSFIEYVNSNKEYKELQGYIVSRGLVG